jgi:hypothetical protein
VVVVVVVDELDDVLLSFSRKTTVVISLLSDVTWNG